METSKRMAGPVNAAPGSAMGGDVASTRARPHVCPRCSRAFLRSEHLQRHITSHEKTKPHFCASCSSRFGRADALLRHQKKCRHQNSLGGSSSCRRGNTSPGTRQGLRPSPAEDQARSPGNSSRARQGSSHSPHSPHGREATHSSGLQQGGEDSAGQPQASANKKARSFNQDPSHLCRELIVQLPSPPATTSQSAHDRCRGNLQQRSGSRQRAEGDFVPELDLDGPQITSLAEEYPSNLEEEFCPGVLTLAEQQQFSEPMMSAPVAWSSTNVLQPNAMDLSNINLDGLGFLEDAFLRQFTYQPSGLTNPPSPTTFGTVAGVPGTADDQDAVIQPANPRSSPEARPRRHTTDALQVSVDELGLFYANLIGLDPAESLSDFRRPSLSRTQRCITAYFQHFDPHTPLIHYASFKISETHPALVLIMLAIGATHISEKNFANSAYDASCILLTEHAKRIILEVDSSFHLWYAQAALLCAQFGVCSGDKDILIRAQQHLSTAHTILFQALELVQLRRDAASFDWSSWILVESWSRATCWLFVVSAMCLSFDPFSAAIIPPVPAPVKSPGNESIWHAVSEGEWKTARTVDSTAESVDLWVLAKTIFNGQKPDPHVRIGAFTLLALIGTFLASICTRMRLSMDIYDPCDEVYVSKIEKALATWKGLWQRHPRAELSKTGLDDPLLNDCLSLLGSAYYHLYVGKQLAILKRIAENPNCGLKIPEYKDDSEGYKVIKYAANSWLIRAKIGLRHLSKAGGLDLGCQGLSAIYESALILGWWLHLHGEFRWPPVDDQSGLLEHERPTAAVVASLFRDILGELEEQDICCNQPGTSAQLDPIDFYACLCDGWVWGCSSVVKKRLRTFASFLEQCR